MITSSTTTTTTKTRRRMHACSRGERQGNIYRGHNVQYSKQKYGREIPLTVPCRIQIWPGAGGRGIASYIHSENALLVISVGVGVGGQLPERALTKAAAAANSTELIDHDECLSGKYKMPELLIPNTFVTTHNVDMLARVTGQAHLR
jgi:hypothetical protein